MLKKCLGLSLLLALTSSSYAAKYPVQNMFERDWVKACVNKMVYYSEEEERNLSKNQITKACNCMKSELDILVDLIGKKQITAKEFTERGNRAIDRCYAKAGIPRDLGGGSGAF